MGVPLEKGGIPGSAKKVLNKGRWILAVFGGSETRFGGVRTPPGGGPGGSRGGGPPGGVRGGVKTPQK